MKNNNGSKDPGQEFEHYVNDWTKRLHVAAASRDYQTIASLGAEQIIKVFTFDAAQGATDFTFVPTFFLYKDGHVLITPLEGIKGNQLSDVRKQWFEKSADLSSGIDNVVGRRCKQPDFILQLASGRSLLTGDTVALAEVYVDGQKAAECIRAFAPGGNAEQGN